MGSFLRAYSSANKGWGSNLKIDQNIVKRIQDEDSFLEYAFANSNNPNAIVPPTIISNENETNPDSSNETTDAVLKFMNQVLLDDDLETKPSTIENSTLEAAEKSFYDVLNYDTNKRYNILCSCNISSTNDLFDIVSDLQKYKSSTCTCPARKEAFESKMVRSQTHRLVRPRSFNTDENEFVQGRSNKHVAVGPDETVLHEMFDSIFSLYGKRKENKVVTDPSIKPTRKGLSKREAVELRNLLTQCMKSLAVSNNDNTSNASKLLRKIRSRACVSGDGTQRLAHYFADGLEARLFGGRGLPIHINHALKSPCTEVWKAFQQYLTVFPFWETSYFYANQMIMTLAEKQETSTIHIIHYGIMHGLQWPPFIKSLSKRPGGPPKLRITGIDFPQTGFRPDSTVGGVKHRLANICRDFNVPFEYYGFVKNWESVTLEDLNIKKDEVVVVNCLYHSMYLLDDTVVDYSPRDVILRFIRTINPDLFIHVIVNGTYNSPFFMSRFREALFHFSTLFDMHEVNLARDNHLRMVFEREIWGREISNIVACEGMERIERPETYKQWQLRTIRAGFKQVPLNDNIVKQIRSRLSSCYHKDFFVDEAGDWLLDGWKGRALFGLASWEPFDKDLNIEKKATC